MRRRQHRKIGWVLLFLLLAVILIGGAVLQQKTDFLHTVKFVPPFITSHSCIIVEQEINKYDWDHELALAVAKAESECNNAAYGDNDLKYVDCPPEYVGDPQACDAHKRDYGYSIGIFQVRILPGREKCDNYDIATNISCAYDIYKEKGDFTPWSGFTTGKYRNYLWHTVL